MTLAVTVTAKPTFRMDERERRAVKFRQVVVCPPKTPAVA